MGRERSAAGGWAVEGGREFLASIAQAQQFTDLATDLHGHSLFAWFPGWASWQPGRDKASGEQGSEMKEQQKEKLNGQRTAPIRKSPCSCDTRGQWQ